MPVVRAELVPKGPYSLRLSGRHASDATRVVVDGTYRAVIRVDDRVERVQAAQGVDGTVVVAAESDAGIDHVRFALALDDDHSEFVRRFADDRLLGETLRRVRGLRPMRTGSVAQSLLRAVAGQLIRASEARRIERRIIRTTTPALGDLHAAPTAAELGRFETKPSRRGAVASIAELFGWFFRGGVTPVKLAAAAAAVATTATLAVAPVVRPQPTPPTA